ncbi:family 43 glycosylhydrolase [Alistipes sp. kh20]|uniref:family 43 glycosylhydrolase n=1 Tax=Alistipes montrealensis TaxID=2834113 RepID=UPI001BCF8099|nr:family 43 glycosylhydrolase [Alistipes montrealensis]MBS4765594.1 family 43 glycosylhydrolase [Alistipes montrealensis]
MNKMISTFAILCGTILSACSQSESSPAGPDGPATGEPATILTAPKNGLSVNLDALSNLTFWWERTTGKPDGYELIFDLEGGDFTAPAASFPAGGKTELTLSYQDVKTLYQATQKDGTASLIWTVNALAGDKTYGGKESRKLIVTNTMEPYIVEALFTPENGSRADLTLLEENLHFSWSAAKTSGTKTPSYTLLFDRKGGDFSAPLASFDLAGKTEFDLSKEEVRKLFDAHAESGSETLPLVWTVRCNVEDNAWLASEQYQLTVTTLPVAYSNAIFTNFSLPDPDVIRGDDGYFYLYATEHKRNDPDMKNSPIMRSPDLISWTRVGSLFTDSTHPQITDQDAGIWAPSVNKVGNKYVIYYSQPGKNYKHAIGVAVSDSPTGPFTDLGKLIDSNEQGVEISIDAYLYQEDGRNYLFWGSFRSISVLELTEDGTAIKNKATQKRREVAGGQYEASVVLKRDNWYYLIVSTGDYSKGGTYRIVVGRSQSVFGPYVDKNGNDMMSVHHELVLKGNSTFSSPGHCSRIITDDAGQDWILYHAYPNDKDYRCLMLDRINWVDGWPVSPGQQPTSQSVDRPVFNK